MDTDGGSLHGDLDPQYYAVVIKAMLVHRAKWGNRAGALDQSIRYGVAVTIETGEGIAVYDEIRTRLGMPIAAPIP